MSCPHNQSPSSPQRGKSKSRARITCTRSRKRIRDPRVNKAHALHHRAARQTAALRCNPHQGTELSATEQVITRTGTSKVLRLVHRRSLDADVTYAPTDRISKGIPGIGYLVLIVVEDACSWLPCFSRNCGSVLRVITMRYVCFFFPLQREEGDRAEVPRGIVPGIASIDRLLASESNRNVAKSILIEI
jgi:hypothetical protein